MEPEKVFLPQDQLEIVRHLQSDYQKTKLDIGELELKKDSAIGHARYLESEIGKMNADISAQYGADSVINLQTGEITQRPNTTQPKQPKLVIN